MAAYAALVSLMHIIDQIQLHPRPPISLNKQQVQSLTKNVTFLEEFLEAYPHVAGYSNEPDALESRIADAAYAAEDIIESYLVDQIAGSTSHDKKISFLDFYEGLQKVIKDMDSIKKEVVEIKEKTEVQDKLKRNSTPVAGPSRSSSTGQNNNMVGFDDVLYEVMVKLIGGKPDRQVIPIVGMGSIGKTTLARNIYQNQAVMEHFDILVWVTISQEYSEREILLKLLQQDWDSFGENENDLGYKLRKRLWKRMYLIIMDDIWDIEVWNQLKFFFPDNNNGSRIILTTRLSNMASEVADSCGIDMAFLDEDNSWNLFSKTVFGGEGWPLELEELEEIGKKIVKNCKGLPLSIVVIGGLLANCKDKREYWEYVEENLISVVNSEDHGSCLKILHMSYSQLPVYLKPCFLHMGVFEEDSEIHVSTLIELWVAEGFLKPVSGKSLEEIAKNSLKELIHRNLIQVHKLGPLGDIKYCKIHDLLRDLCLREAPKGRFYYVIKQHSLNVPEETNTQRRVVIRRRTVKDKVLDALQSMPLVRSLLCDIEGVQPLPNFRLLRIWKSLHLKSHLEDVLQYVNLRYFSVGFGRFTETPPSIYVFWNLHTLHVKHYYRPSTCKNLHYRPPGQHSSSITAQFEIWNMPQLRGVYLDKNYSLPDPPSGNVGGQDDIVLGNLHTLKGIRNFKFGEEVVRRIPNVKKLHVAYGFEPKSGLPDYCLNNLERLHKLESFYCWFKSSLEHSGTYFVQNLTFPHSLKKMTLVALTRCIHWEDMLEKIGSLPLLEKLKLREGSFKGGKWETIEGQFSSLKFLQINGCDNLECWTTEASPFPRLERLELIFLKELKEIPSEIGDISTLQSIELIFCSDSAVVSAKRVQDEQEELQGEVGFQVRVVHWKNEALESLATPNFRFEN